MFAEQNYHKWTSFIITISMTITIAITQVPITIVVAFFVQIVCVIDLVLYSVRVCVQMADYMNISVFSITPPYMPASAGGSPLEKPVNSSVANVRMSRDDSGTASSHSRSSSSSSCDTSSRLPTCAAVRGRNAQRCSWPQVSACWGGLVGRVIVVFRVVISFFLSVAF